MKFLLFYILFFHFYLYSDGMPILNIVKRNIQFKYRALPTMNNNKPLKLDVIVIYDQSLFSILNNLTATQYYETRETLYSSNKHLMTISSWDVQPGKVSPNYELFIGVNPIAILIFGNYNNLESNHKLIIPMGTDHIMVFLNEKTLISPDNGIDYLNLGKNKEFQVLEIIDDNIPTNRQSIPDGLNKFYKISNNNLNELSDDNNYEPINVKPLNNKPLKLENLSPLTKDSVVINEDFVIPINTIGRIWLDHLGDYLLSNEGIVDDNILENHGFSILKNIDLNEKYYRITIGSFNNNKLFYLTKLNHYLNDIENNRSSPLEFKKIIHQKNKILGKSNNINGTTNDNENLNKDNNENNNTKNSDGNNKDNNGNPLSINNSNKNPLSNGNKDGQNNKSNPLGINNGFNKNNGSSDGKDGKNNSFNGSFNGKKSDNIMNDTPMEKSNNKNSNDNEPESKPVKKDPVSYNSPSKLNALSKSISPRLKWWSLLSRISNAVKTVKRSNTVKYT